MKSFEEILPDSESSIHLAIKPPNFVIRTYEIDETKANNVYGYKTGTNIKLPDHLNITQEMNSPFPIMSPSPRAKKFKLTKKKLENTLIAKKQLTLAAPKKVDGTKGFFQ